MKIWIHLNGVQEGPFTEADLPLHRMDENTPVWYAGLDDWQPAGRAPLTAALLADYRRAAAQGHAAAQATVAPGSQWQAAGRQTAANGDERPLSYMVWSVLLTVLCCNPVGILAIIYGAKVTSRLNNYDIEGARRASETAAWWLMITIVTGLVFAPLSMLVNSL